MSRECDQYYPSLHDVQQIRDIVTTDGRRQSVYIDMAELDRRRHVSGHDESDDGGRKFRQSSESDKFNNNSGPMRPRSGTYIADNVLNDSHRPFRRHLSSEISSGYYSDDN